MLACHLKRSCIHWTDKNSTFLILIWFFCCNGKFLSFITIGNLFESSICLLMMNINLLIWSLAECGKQIGFRITTKWKIWDIKHLNVSKDSPNIIIIYELEPSESLKCQKTTLSAKMSYRVTKTRPDEFKRKVESG